MDVLDDESVDPDAAKRARVEARTLPVHEPDGKRRRRYRGRATLGAPSRSHEALFDLDEAIEQLTTARDEIKAIEIPSGARNNGYIPPRVGAQLVEPLSRVDLVRRFCVEVLRRLKWEGLGRINDGEDG